MAIVTSKENAILFFLVLFRNPFDLISLNSTSVGMAKLWGAQFKDTALKIGCSPRNLNVV